MTGNPSELVIFGLLCFLPTWLHQASGCVLLFQGTYAALLCCIDVWTTDGVPQPQLSVVADASLLVYI